MGRSVCSGAPCGKHVRRWRSMLKPARRPPIPQCLGHLHELALERDLGQEQPVGEHHIAEPAGAPHGIDAEQPVDHLPAAHASRHRPEPRRRCRRAGGVEGRAAAGAQRAPRLEDRVPGVGHGGVRAHVEAVDERLQPAGMPHVVVGPPGEELRLRIQLGRQLERSSPVARQPEATRVAMERDAIVARHVAARDRRRQVIRAVVDEHESHVAIRLCQQRFERFGERLAAVVDGDADDDSGGSSSSRHHAAASRRGAGSRWRPARCASRAWDRSASCS